MPNLPSERAINIFVVLLIVFGVAVVVGQLTIIVTAVLGSPII